MPAFATPIFGKCASSIGGVRRVWLAEKKYVTDYTYAADELGIIDRILNSGGNPSSFYEYDCDGEFVQAGEDLKIDQRGRSFPQTIRLRFAAMDYMKRATLQALIYTRLACVYEDQNGRYWLLGQEFGLKATVYSAQTDVFKGGNRYEIELIGTERMQVREVNKVNFIYTFPNGVGSSLPTGGAAPTPPATPKVTGLGGSGPNGGITADLSTWGQYHNGEMVRPMPLSQLGIVPLKDFFA